MAFTIPDNENVDLRVLHTMNTFPFRKALLCIKLWHNGEYDHLSEDELKRNAFEVIQDAVEFDDPSYSQFFKAEIDRNDDDYPIVLTLNLSHSCDYNGLLESKGDKRLGFSRENDEDEMCDTDD